MKKITFLLLIICLAAGTPNAQNARVQGTFTSSHSNSTTLIVSMVSGNQVIPTDTLTTDKKGMFLFEKTLSGPTMFLLTFPSESQNPIHLIIYPKDNISLTMQLDDSTGFIHLLSAKGSKDMQLYQAFNHQLFQFNKRAKALDNEYNQQETSAERRRGIGDDFMKLQTEQNIAVKKLLTQNADVLMSAFLVTYFDNEIETYLDIYELIDQKLSGKYSDNQFVQYVSGKVKSNLGPGRMAPEIAMKDPEGNIRKLSDLKGKIVMIDFWASWCRPCRMENPNVVKLYHRYHDKGFEIYSVSLDKSHNDWVKAIAQDGLVWPNHVSDLNGWTSSGGASYGITSVPSTVLIDRQGRIIAKNLRGAELANKLKEIFGE